MMIKTFIITVLSLLLISCQDNYSYSYLIQHPQVLQREVNACQNQFSQNDTSKQCELIMYAATNLMSTINELQESPERFGQKILQAQYALVESKTAYLQAVEKVKLLKKQRSEIDANVEQTKVLELENNYKHQKEQVNMLLAVAGLESPE